MNEQEFINSVRAYANEHYETGGWDYVVEAWSNEEILKYLSDANGNCAKAFKNLAKFVRIYHDYAEDIRNS